MRQDVHALQKFYDSPLGAAALQAALARLTALWPDASGRDMLGLGYAGPYLAPYQASARRTVMFAPGPQGAERWPEEGRALVCLGDENRLPFMDAVFDRVILVHALEEAAAPRPMLREVWRVTAPEGRLVVITANRAGVWALASPFHAASSARCCATICLNQPRRRGRSMLGRGVLACRWPARSSASARRCGRRWAGC
jgi:SAM-dependent methyltransferase